MRKDIKSPEMSLGGCCLLRLEDFLEWRVGDNVGACIPQHWWFAAQKCECPSIDGRPHAWNVQEQPAGFVQRSEKHGQFNHGLLYVTFMSSLLHPMPYSGVLVLDTKSPVSNPGEWFQGMSFYHSCNFKGPKKAGLAWYTSDSACGQVLGASQHLRLFNPYVTPWLPTEVDSPKQIVNSMGDCQMLHISVTY